MMGQSAEAFRSVTGGHTAAAAASGKHAAATKELADAAKKANDELQRATDSLLTNSERESASVQKNLEIIRAAYLAKTISLAAYNDALDRTRTLTTQLVTETAKLPGDLSQDTPGTKWAEDFATGLAGEQEVKAWEDWNAAMSKADDAVASARADLTAAYGQEVSAIEATRGKLVAFSDTLGAFLQQLRTGDLALNGPITQTALTRARFGSTADLALSGDQAARDAFIGASTEFLTASKASSKTALEYARDNAAVKRATQALQSMAATEISVADQQLAALHAQVAGLGIVNASVLTVAQAVAQLAAAQGARDALVATAPAAPAAGGTTASDWSPGGSLWSQWASAGASSGADRGSVLADWSRSEQLFLQEYRNAAGVGSLSVLDAYWGLNAGTAASFADRYGLQKFAAGGVVDSPTLGLFGEAGPETIMPLARGSDGMLGVRSNGGDGADTTALEAKVEQLNDKVEQQTKVLVQIMKNTRSTDSTLFRVTRGGNGVVVDTSEQALRVNQV